MRTGEASTKGQSLVVAVVLILTAVVLSYPRGVQEEPDIFPVSRVAVVVSKVDIPAGTDMDQLIKDDQFRLIEVPKDAADGAVTSIDQLSDRHNSVKIWHGELIRVGRMWSVDAMRRERLEFLGG